MEASYESQQQQQQPLMGGGGGGGSASLRPSSFDEFATTMLAPPRWGSLPLALQQHPSPLLAALAVALLLALQTTAPVAGAWAMLAAALLSALVQLLTHTHSGGGRSTVRGRSSRGGGGAGGGSGSGASAVAAAAKTGSPSALASLSLDAAVAIAAASWLAVWAWADPPGRAFWLRWQPALVLALLAAELTASLLGLPCASPPLHDKAPPLLMQMDLSQRPRGGDPAEAPWLRRLARDVTLAWALVAALAAACCCVPAAMGRHAFARGGGPGGGAGLGWARGGGGEGPGGDGGGGGGEGPGGGGGRAPGDADGLDVALSVCAPLALVLAAAALSDAVLERARRAHLPRMMAEASRAAAAAGGGGPEMFAAPPGGSVGV